MAKNNNRTSGFAITSFILGLLFFIPVLGFIFNLGSIVIGFMALQQIKKDRVNGSKLAKTGIILGFVGIILTFVIIWFITQIPASADRILYKDRTIDPTHNIIKQYLGRNRSELEIYKTDNGRYPTNLRQMEQDGRYKVVLGLATGEKNNPMDEFYYSVTEDGLNYDLRWLGLDRKYNTADDVIAQ